MPRLLFLSSVAYLMVGIAQLVIGTVMEPMVNDYGIGYGDGGQLVMNQFLGGMMGILCAPWLITTIGKKALLLTALSMILIVQLIYSLEPSWAVMLAVSPITGMGIGITEATVGSFIIMAAAGDANKAMSRIEVFFGIGALLMPFVGSLLIAGGHWKLSFLFVGALAAAALALWILFWPKILDKSRGLNSSPETHRGSSVLSGGRARLTLAACTLFFAVYVGIEMSYIHYLPSMMVRNNGLAESTASLSISVYWMAMTVGRWIAGHLADRFGGASYLVSMCGLNAVVFLLMTGMDGVAPTFVLTVLSGLAMSGMFSIALVFANRAIPGITERTTSLLMAGGWIGGALLPKLTGWFLDRFHEDNTRWLFAAFGMILLIVMIWAVAAVAKQKRRDSAISANVQM